jgi:4'-phosphopantetheinyl transferase
MYNNSLGYCNPNSQEQRRYIKTNLIKYFIKIIFSTIHQNQHKLDFVFLACSKMLYLPLYMKQVFYKNTSNGNHLYVWKVYSCANTLLEKITLSNKELKEFKVLKNKKRRLEFVACRRALKNIFSCDLILNHRETGQPYIKEAAHLSISHSHQYIAIAFGTENIGVDIELPQQKMQQIISRILSTKEYRLYLKNPSNEQACKLWGIKEAVLKYVGDKNLNYRDDIQISRNNVSYLAHQFVVQHETVDEMILTYVAKK